MSVLSKDNGCSLVEIKYPPTQGNLIRLDLHRIKSDMNSLLYFGGRGPEFTDKHLNTRTTPSNGFEGRGTKKAKKPELN